MFWRNTSRRNRDTCWNVLILSNLQVCNSRNLVIKLRRRRIKNLIKYISLLSTLFGQYNNIDKMYFWPWDKQEILFFLVHDDNESRSTKRRRVCVIFQNKQFLWNWVHNKSTILFLSKTSIIMCNILGICFKNTKQTKKGERKFLEICQRF